MESLSVIIIVLAAMFAVYWTFRIDKLVPKVVNIGMTLGVILVITPALQLFTVGMYIYLGFVILAFFFGLADKKRKLIDRLVICLMTAGMFLFWLWHLNHWHGNTILMPVFVLIIAMVGALSKAKLRNEFGFLAIIVADAIAVLLSY
jgi:hypothetical protein